MHKQVSRRDFLNTTVRAGAAATLADRVASAVQQDAEAHDLNVLFIQMDQLTGRCLGYANHPCVKTPNLDKLAREGVVFDNAFCPTPYCSPTRASILTGLYPHQTGVVTNVGQPERDPAKGLSPDSVLTESVLYDHGYAIGHRGKWHTGDFNRHKCYGEEGAWHDSKLYQKWLDTVLPADELGAPPSDVELFNRPLYVTDRIRQVHKEYNDAGMVHGQDLSKIGRTSVPHEYLQDAWYVNQTLDLMDKYKDKSFMLTCSMDAPHAWWAISEPFYSMYKPGDIELPHNRFRPESVPERAQGVWLYDALHEEGVKEYLRCYYGMVTHADYQIGRMLDKLKQIGQYDNTLIIFTSDHGDMNGAHSMVTKTIGPQMYDEVMRTPMLFWRPGLIPQGRRVQTPVTHVDIMPTILDYLDKPIPKHIVGETLRPYIEGKEDLARVTYGERTTPEAIHLSRLIRTEEWNFWFTYKKWNEKVDFHYWTPPELYNRITDPGEENNLFNDPKYREIALRLDKQLREAFHSTGDPWIDGLPALDL